MRGNNTSFRADPTGYISRTAINSVSGFQVAALGAMGRQRVSLLNALGEGQFDLRNGAQPGGVTFVPSGDYSENGGEQAISAYWCPFIQGNSEVGSIEIPAHAPEHSFLFTAAMNGCSLQVVPAPGGRLRVFHNQHPHNANLTNIVTNQGQREIIAELNYADYGNEDAAAVSNAFCFMYYTNNRWHLIAQPQTIAADLSVSINPGIPPVVRPVPDA